MLTRDIKIMELARRLAINNPGIKDRFKLTAILVYKRDIVSIGNNGLRTHPLQKKYGKNEEAIFLHAEIDAIAQGLNHISREELKASTLYVHRVKRNSPIKHKAEWVDGLACPCDGCQGAIHAFGIKRVIYSTNIDKQYNEVYY